MKCAQGIQVCIVLKAMREQVTPHGLLVGQRRSQGYAAHFTSDVEVTCKANERIPWSVVSGHWVECEYLIANAGAEWIKLRVNTCFISGRIERIVGIRRGGSLFAICSNQKRYGRTVLLDHVERVDRQDARFKRKYKRQSSLVSHHHVGRHRAHACEYVLRTVPTQARRTRSERGFHGHLIQGLTTWN